MKRLLALLFLVVVCFALAQGFVFAQDNALGIATDADPPTLDPTLGNQGYTFTVTAQVFDTLLYRDFSDDQLKGRLATSWEQLDPNTWRFTLQEGVTFHDGTPFNAEAVKFTLDRLLDPEFKAPNAFQLSAIKEVKVIDDSTVDIITSAPFAPLVPTLTHPLTGIVSPTAAKELGDEFGRNPVGTGPYRFESWLAGDSVTLVANENYWQGAPTIERIVYRIIPEAATQLLELKAGGLDVLSSVPPEAVSELEQTPNVTVKKLPGATHVYLGFNTQNGITKDLKVRQAIASAIDLDGIINGLLAGVAEKGIAPITPRVFGAATDLEPIGFDLERSKTLLQEAGVAPGTKLSLITPNTTLFGKLAQAVQFSAQQVGLDVEVQLLEFANYQKTVQEADHAELFIYWWTPISRDADTGLYGRFHSKNIPANNHSFYNNPEVDAWLDEARASGDPEERIELYHKVQEQINADLPVFTLAYPFIIYVTSNRLVGEVQNTTLELYRATLE